MRLPIGMPEKGKLSKESANVKKSQLFQKNLSFFVNRSVSPAASSTDYSYYSLSLAFVKRLAESHTTWSRQWTVNLATAGETRQAFLLQNAFRITQNNQETKRTPKKIILNFQKNTNVFWPLVPPRDVLPPPIKSIAEHAALHAPSYWHAW